MLGALLHTRLLLTSIYTSVHKYVRFRNMIEKVDSLLVGMKIII